MPRRFSASAKIPKVPVEFSPPLDVVDQNPLHTEESGQDVAALRELLRIHVQRNETSPRLTSRGAGQIRINPEARAFAAIFAEGPMLPDDMVLCWG